MKRELDYIRIEGSLGGKRADPGSACDFGNRPFCMAVSAL